MLGTKWKLLGAEGPGSCADHLWAVQISGPHQRAVTGVPQSPLPSGEWKTPVPPLSSKTHPA